MSNRPKEYCKDCWQVEEDLDIAHSTRPRPTPHPGPRCATHWHMERKRRKAAAHEAAVIRTYGLKKGEYQKLYDAQLGTCAICLRATGKTRKLSVDHDHESGQVRGLLCRPCNDMLGHARDSDMFFYRAANYLQRPPAKGVLGHE